MKYFPSADRYYPLAVDLWFPQRARLEGAAPGVDGFNVMGEFALDLSNLSYRLHSLSLYLIPPAGTFDTVHPSTQEVDGAALRSLSLTELKDGLGALGVHDSDLPAEARKGYWDAEPERGDDKLAQVAQIYVRESISGRRPAKGVSEGMEAPISTAGYWIRRAKDLGYIRSPGDVDSGLWMPRISDTVVSKSPLDRLKLHAPEEMGA